MTQKKAGIEHGGATWRWNTLSNRARILAKDLAEVRERRRASQYSLEDRQADLVEFYDRFEKFVETICDAAQYGPNARLDAAYLSQKARVAEAYPRIKSFVDAFLPPEDPDAFERLLSADDLSRFLAEDDGTVIFLITGTRQALSLYAEHLRQLTARCTP